MTESGDITGWTERLEGALRTIPKPLFDRVIVLEEAESTQDEAMRRAEERPGLIVLAARQTAGRGRLGRLWEHSAELGLAATFVVDGSRVGPERLSIAAGLGAAMALEELAGGSVPLGVRWPNDVVEVRSEPGGGRKLAGVLVERRGSLAALGVGINVNQGEGDFPPVLRGRAASLRQVARAPGRAWDRIEVAIALLRALHRVFAMGLPELIQEWLARDVLKGSVQTFVHNGREVRGLVESLEPTAEIVVRTTDGGRVRLPALTTSLVKS
jgi:BirA family transcriptional regulator, biotin operon repressor / biotin---[acetyl-CoA-carboxylase] ligase